MNDTDNDRLRACLNRLMDGHREALMVIRQALADEVPAEDALGELEDILGGASEDAHAILNRDGA